ncbi:energy transducer TonB [Luteimonas sp. WGS1318]|uniref:energy transducer TonB n=1 Tax=Luteimonas sp. WGS1318 TaxID=3366815 RepID=UPI00372D4C62
MSDPMQRPHDAPPPEGAPRKGSSPLIWILLLVVLVAVGWYFLSQRTPSAPPEVPDAPVIGDGIAPPAEREPTPAAADPVPARPAVTADRDARPLSQPEPVYPPAAARNREEGTVVLLVQVGADGRPNDVNVETRSRSRDLDRAAIDAVRGWTFEPAIRNGKAEASAVRVPVEFTLDERSAGAGN